MTEVTFKLNANEKCRYDMIVGGKTVVAVIHCDDVSDMGMETYIHPSVPGEVGHYKEEIKAELIFKG